MDCCFPTFSGFRRVIGIKVKNRAKKESKHEKPKGLYRAARILVRIFLVIIKNFLYKYYNDNKEKKTSKFL